MTPSDLSLAEARGVTLAAQGFTGRSGPADAGAIRALIGRLGALQIDSVNVLTRSHYLPAFSRLGPYDRGLLDRVAYARPRRILEYWGHEASFIPAELYPALRWRMERARKGAGIWKHVAEAGLKQKSVVRRVREAIEERGPLSASDLGDEKNGEPWWGWSRSKSAIEFLFWCGDVTAVGRRSSFERIYDLTERAIPARILARSMPEDDQYDTLVGVAARAFGIATESDLRDYFRLPLLAARASVARLCEQKLLRPVRVAGWKQQAYLVRGARAREPWEGTALLSPFDSLVWNRERTHRLFDFHYRIEIYTPAHKRVHGYYVLPYLFGGTLAARLDLKADRADRTLLVHAMHLEPGVSKKAIMTPLRDDLQKMAQWLGLERVQMPPR